MYLSKQVLKITMFIFLIFFTVSAYPQTDDNHRTDDMNFKIIIYGPSDEIFIWWGHAALIVEYEYTDYVYSRVFDWGIFSYEGDNFIKEFIYDRVQYLCRAGLLNIQSYIYEDRDITIYNLDLDRKGKETILSNVENNILPENRYYDYHEFRDNCSTRIRDILDLGTNGQFKAAFDSVTGRLTTRQHVRRFTWAKPFSDWALDFLMGRDLDQKISVWDEMFLPVEIARNIVDFSYIDDLGIERKLVSSVEIINSSKQRQPILNAAFVTWPFVLPFGLIIAAILFYIKNKEHKYKLTCRIILGLSQSLLGLILGALGCLLTIGLFFMNNDYIQQNINFLFVNPLLLIIFPLGIMAAINKPQKINPVKCLSIAWTCVFIACLVTVLLWLVPSFRQQNQSIVALILPISFALSCLPDKILRSLK